MRHYLNVCNVNGGEIEPVDIITFGSPCQDLSVAGKRCGLKHDELGDGETTRSGLFMDAVRIIKEMRGKTDGRCPTFATWENVPGAFSSQKGEDFRVVLEKLAKIKASDAAVPRPPNGKWADAGAILGDGWSLAWRVLDAQFHGVPQRRRRILVVADFAGGRAPQILFECAGLPGYPAESGAAGQGAAGDAAGGSVADDRADGVTAFHLTQDTISSEEISPSLSYGNPKNGQDTVGICAAFSAGQDAKAVCLDCRNMVGNTELSATLQAKGDGGFSLNYINPVCVGFDGYNQEVTGDVAQTIRANKSDADHVGIVIHDARGNGACAIVPTITGDHEGHISDYTELAYREDADTYISARPAYSIGNGQVDSTSLNEEVVGALNCMHDQQAVISHVDEYIVRRLTPTECARLQGFPDWWGELPTITNMSDEDYDFWCDVLKTKAEIEDNPYKPKTRPQMVAWYNKLQTDGAAYKMWGNGVALPVVRVPLHEMAKLGARTLGSLFDGSGGFPLAGVLEGITPLWASEIEPYPIAVTRARFREVTP